MFALTVLICTNVGVFPIWNLKNGKSIISNIISYVTSVNS